MLKAGSIQAAAVYLCRRAADELNQIVFRADRDVFIQRGRSLRVCARVGE